MEGERELIEDVIKKGKRRSRSMWEKTTSTGSFTITNPLALLDENGNLRQGLNLNEEVLQEVIGTMPVASELSVIMKKAVPLDSTESFPDLAPVNNNNSTTGQGATALSPSSSTSSTSSTGSNKQPSKEQLHALSSARNLNGSREELNQEDDEEEEVEEEDIGANEEDGGEKKEEVKSKRRGLRKKKDDVLKKRLSIFASRNSSFFSSIMSFNTDGNEPSSSTPNPEKSPRSEEESRMRFEQARKQSIEPSEPIIFAYKKSLEIRKLPPLERQKDGEKAIVSGSLEALVGSLFGIDPIDYAHLEELLITYKYFTATDQLLKEIMAHWTWEQADKSDFPSMHEWVHFRRLRWVSVIRKWIQLYPGDFPKKGEAEQLLLSFINTQKELCEKEAKYLSSLAILLTDKKSFSLLSSLNYGVSSESISIVENGVGNELRHGLTSKQKAELNQTTFSDFKIETMAEQFTLLEWQLFSSINQEDISDIIMNSDNPTGKTLLKIANWSHKVHHWAATEVCITSEFKQRVSVLKRLLTLAKIFLEHYNYNGFFEIVTGLSMGPVQRMISTWKSLPPKFKEMWQEFYAIISPKDNYRAYKEEIRKAYSTGSPVIPNLKLYLSDLVETMEEMPTYMDKEKKILNFRKFHLIGSSLLNFRKHQRIPYNFKLLSKETFWLRHATVVMDVNDLNKLSELCEQ